MIWLLCRILNLQLIYILQMQFANVPLEGATVQMRVFSALQTAYPACCAKVTCHAGVSRFGCKCFYQAPIQARYAGPVAVSGFDSPMKITTGPQVVAAGV